MEKVVLVTGANSGIGLALCERLLSLDSQVSLCLACRSMQRAEAARSALLASHSDAHINLIRLDVGDISSVLRAAQEVKMRYKRLDYIYLNAGIMPDPQVDIRAFFKGLFSRNVVKMFATAEGLLTQQDHVTKDGLQEVFATNLFGHFLMRFSCSSPMKHLIRFHLIRCMESMESCATEKLEELYKTLTVRELEPVLCQPGHTAQLIWTSSSNARRSAFDLDDLQHQRGTEPYSSSKYAVDLLSVALNRHHNQQGIYSSVICPGLVMTNLTYGILPSFLWTLIMPIMLLIRIFTNTFTLTPYNGAEALCWLYLQKPESLDPLAKYHSLTSGLGKNYTAPRKMDVVEDMSEALYDKLLKLEIEIRKKSKDAEQQISDLQHHLNEAP